MYIFVQQKQLKIKNMTTTEIKKTLKSNGVLNPKVRKVKYMKNIQFGIFNWNFDEISKEKMNLLFPNIMISAVGQAWL